MSFSEIRSNPANQRSGSRIPQEQTSERSMEGRKTGKTLKSTMLGEARFRDQRKEYLKCFGFTIILIVSLGLVGFLLGYFFPDKEITVAIIGTNDIHGSAFPTLLARQDTGQKYNYGGMAYMGRLIDIVKNQFPNRSIYLDAGDQFQGGIESSSLISSGSIMNDFYSAMNLQGAAIGNHQFDFGPNFLFPYLQNRNSTNVAANVRSQSGAKQFMPRHKNSLIFNFQEGIKVGVIGLTTLETPSSTSGFTKALFPPYNFLNYTEVVIKEAAFLRERGVDAILVLAHVGNDCPQKLNYGVWTKQSLQKECPSDEITQLIDSLPQGTIDGVVQGHRHRIVHHFYKNVPFMGSINGGYYFNIMHLKFKVGTNLRNTKKLFDITIEGPIPVCQKVFQNNGRCNHLNDAELQEAGPLVNWKFHGEDVYAHPKIKQIYDTKWLPKMQPYFEEIAINEIILQKEYNVESQLGNLLTNFVHNAVPQADFVLLNSGGFRTVWMPGVIQFQHVYGMEPFGNTVKTFRINGKELKQVLRVAQQGASGFYPMWNIQTWVQVGRDAGKNIISKKYLGGNFMNGTQLDDNTEYIGASIDFILLGGDDFKQIIVDRKIYTPRGVQEIGKLLDIYKNQLKTLKTIKSGSLVDPKNPRLIVSQI